MINHDKSFDSTYYYSYTSYNGFFVVYEIAIDLELRYSFFTTTKKLYKMGLLKMQIHGTVCLVAHGTEEELTPQNFLNLWTHIFVTSEQ